LLCITQIIAKNRKNTRIKIPFQELTCVLNCPELLQNPYFGQMIIIGFANANCAGIDEHKSQKHAIRIIVSLIRHERHSLKVKQARAITKL
jgi:hypothetical protein